MCARPRWRAFRSAAWDGPKSWPISSSSCRRRLPATSRARPSPLTVRPAMRCRALATVFVLIGIGAAPGAQVVVPAPGEPARPEFSEFVAKLKEQALAGGISAATVDAALTGLEPLEVVVERDRTQAETVLTIDQYLQRRLTRAFVRTATDQARRHRRTLAAIGKKYEVPGRLVVA